MHSVLTSLAALSTTLAADRTWTGGGGDNFWSTPANWGGSAVSANDSLFFGGSVRTSPVNDFPPGAVFGSLNFNPSSSAFALTGNRVTLDSGAITDQQALVPQIINLQLNLVNDAVAVDVVADGSLTLGGVISSSGVGLTKTGDGLLTLTAANTFSGQVTVRGGTLSIAADNNLGVAPGSPAAASIVLESGTLRTTSSLTLNANRGITLTGGGTVRVNAGTTLTYGGVIADGTGAGLTKNSFGGLTLSGANTYTGPTVIENGTITLDFGPATAPANNILSISSALTLGGENAGLGTLSFAAVILNGRTGANNSQSFNGTTVDIGPSIIRANSGSGGTANLALGALGHNPGGVAVFVPPAATGGSINTPSANVNGILGGWALYGDGSAPVGNVTIGQNWASLDGSGNVVPYSGYFDYTSGNLRPVVSSATNLRLTSAARPGGTAAVEIRTDDENAGTVTDINSFAIQTVVAGDTLVIGTGNTLRLGRFGGIFRQDSTTVNITWYIGGTGGTQTGTGTVGSQGIGTLTAGGADNTPGEIVFTINAPSQTQGSVVVEPTITDNGTAPVTVVKTGPGSMKLDGHNTYSGGLYILQGRLQFAGSEIGTPNPSGGGTGLIYVGPGGQWFPSGAASTAIPGAITNELFLAGLGGGAFSSGALRMSGAPQTLAGQINLIGDVFVCGGGNNNTNSQITGKITGNFSFGVGQSGGGENITTYYRIFNQENDYSGDTVISVRNGGAPLSTLLLGNSDVIPNGIGKGNLVLRPGTTTAATLDLQGFNETINGLSVGTPTTQLAVIQNGAASTSSTLSVGDYDASSTFAGLIQNGAGGLGVMNLTKIGGGRQTLTGANTYSGGTTINGGTLAVSGSGSISSSSSITVNGGNLDVSDVTGGFAYASGIDVTNGALVIRSTTGTGIAALSIADGRVRVAGLGSFPVVADVTTLTTGGTSNYVDIASMGAVASYPATFTIIKYTGTIAGAGFNFGLGNVLTPSTVGYVTNNEANSSVDLVLLDGPKPLTWTGLLGPAWDIDSTMNWLAFGITPSVYLDVDSVRFEDTGADTVSLTTTLQPSAVVVNNDLKTYTFTGTGKISGPASLTKDGPGTLIIANSGTNDFFGATTINAGTLQVGNGGAVGNLSAGSVVNNGRLLFNRSDDITVANTIAGGGILEHNGAGILTLAGDNSFSGGVLVSQSTVRAGRATALGTGDGNTTVTNDATLDVNGLNLTAEPVVVSGAGVGGNGAIVNSGGDQTSALRDVTLTGDAVFGGTGRWDIRDTGGPARLSSGGQTLKLTKVGPNAISIVNATVDPLLGDVDVTQGTLRLQDATSGLGDFFNTLTVYSGATLALFNLRPTALNKPIVLRDGATVAHENNQSLVSGQITLLEGTNTFNVSNAGTDPARALILSGAIEGAGTLVKNGAGPLVFAGGSLNYTGPTYVNAGSLLVDGAVVNSPITVSAGGALGGGGSIASPVLVSANGRLAPGTLSSPTANLIFENSLTLRGATELDVSKAGGAVSGDAVRGLGIISYGGILDLNPSGEALAGGDELRLFEFFTASGSFDSIDPATPGPGLTWDTSTLTTDGILRVVAPTPFAFGSVTVAYPDMIFSGAGGPASAEYRVLTSTDLSVPIINWDPIRTNTFGLDGNFDFNLPVDTVTPQRFYILVY